METSAIGCLAWLHLDISGSLNNCRFYMLMHEAPTWFLHIQRYQNAINQGSHPIDNLQNYCLGTRYGARSRSGPVPMTVNFTRSLSSWPRKIFWAQFSPYSGRFQHSNCLQSFCELKAHFFWEEGRSVDRKRRCMARKGEPLIEWPVLICCAVVHRSSKSVRIFLFLIYQRNSSINKTLMQQRRKGPRRYHSLRCIAYLAVGCRAHFS